MNTQDHQKTHDRETYLQEQKRLYGRRLFGVFPAQYPKEILWAFNILPVEIWDPPLEIRRANAHLQPYICSVARLGLELILQGRCDHLDGFLFPHTCDSIQNLASVVDSYLDLRVPCLFFYHPKAPYRPSSRIFFMDCLKGLVSRLEEVFGPLEPSELKKRVDQGRHLASLFRKLYELRRRGELRSSNETFYRTVRLGEFLHPDDFIPLLEGFLTRKQETGRDRPSVIISGILPNPKELLTLLDELGVRVADDDLLGCGRRFLISPSGKSDPFKAMTESYFAMPPCTTRNAPVQERINFLLNKIEQTGAGGIIFNVVKFCEPELFDLPQMVEAVKERGIATLVIDSEPNRGVSGQLSTRIEAFVEMIREGSKNLHGSRF